MLAETTDKTRSSSVYDFKYVQYSIYYPRMDHGFKPTNGLPPILTGTVLICLHGHKIGVRIRSNDSYAMYGQCLLKTIS
jgi:hypothetical protein